MRRSPTPRRRCLLAVLSLAALTLLPGADWSERHRAPTRPEPSAERSAGSSPASSGWWSGTAGIGLLFCVVGGLALMSRRFLPARDVPSGSLRVVGRVTLGSRQSVCLLRVGDRTLVVGTGSNGPPTLLGEWTEPVVAASPTPTSPRPFAVSIPRAGGFDQRIGDDDE